MTSVFLTGGSGCVGHYLVDELAGAGYELFMLVRNPEKLRFDPAERANVHVVRGDLTEIAAQADLLTQMDYCVHAAAAWGGPSAWEVNLRRTHELFSLLNPERLRRAVYFSTASILGKGNQVLHEVDRYGTDYIRSKYHAYLGLPELALHERIVTVFPTLIFGGDRLHPTSHLSSGLPLLKRWAWFLGRLDVDAWFHFIHARDIARLVRHLLEAEEVERDNVLGNAPTKFGEFTRRAAEHFGHHIGWQLHLSRLGLYRLARALGARMAAWDRFCAEYGDFRYRTLNCPAVGLPDDLATVEGILADWERTEREREAVGGP